MSSISRFINATRIPCRTATSRLLPLQYLSSSAYATKATATAATADIPLHVTPLTTTATWQQAIHQAQRLVVDPDSSSAAAAPPIDPIALVGPDLGDLKHNIGKLLSSQHPFVNTVAQHYFSGQGKHIRPLLVLLISQATSVTTQTAIRHDFETMDQPISHGLLNMTPTSLFNRQQHYTPNRTQGGCTVLPTQRRLAEITEMIHTASLLHDDVIDASLTRRNLPSANASFGNKMAVLGGDFLLARASLTLARLRNSECMEIMATCIANLVEGEFMQLKNTSDPDEDKSTFDHYMDKTYMKTGSLIAQSCKAAAVLGGCNDQVKSLAFDFGRHLGLAFQLIDDMLDFTVSAADLGKPAGADLKLGLATAPVLFAWEEYPELEDLIKRKFNKKGDAEKARRLVYQSNGLKRTMALAEQHCQLAIDAIQQLPPSDAQAALIQLSKKSLTRKS